MFSYIKRHWPVYLILALIAIALGVGAAYIVGVKVEHEQSLGADGISESDQALIDGGSASEE